MSDFYIGYLPEAPADLSRFVKKVIAGLAVLAVIVALVLVFAQTPFAKSYFEYGKVREFSGVIVERPYPVLLVARPDTRGVGETYSRYLLVAPGKHGADSLVAGMDRQTVRLRGQLIFRQEGTMIEVAPDSISAGGLVTLPQPSQELGEITVRGEIVDSKCYLGVMNPGSGKVHRDCAARCISGGIPPILIASDGSARYILTDTAGKALERDSLRDFIAEPLTVRGKLARSGETDFLQIDTALLQHEP